MARLTWGADARFFEAGLDRGVLYVGDNPGVAWVGLISVSESPTGGEAVPSYLDGYKFRNRSRSEEFEATIDAFTSPPEFDICDGSANLGSGLFAMHQSRKRFNLSYRTQIGDAFSGLDMGYKIHLVYNALAAPSARSHNTLSVNTEAQILSWVITSRAPQFTGIKPTSHFVIDSRFTPAPLLLSIEDILYGSLTHQARIPSLSELYAMFASFAFIDGGTASAIHDVFVDGGTSTSVPTGTISGGSA